MYKRGVALNNWKRPSPFLSVGTSQPGHLLVVVSIVWADCRSHLALSARWGSLNYRNTKYGNCHKHHIYILSASTKIQVCMHAHMDTHSLKSMEIYVIIFIPEKTVMQTSYWHNHLHAPVLHNVDRTQTEKWKSVIKKKNSSSKLTWSKTKTL